MPHDREITFGRLLRELRLRAGLSQEQLAERAGMSTTGVGVLERELRHAPHRATVELLAEALGLSPVEREALEATAGPRRGRAPVARPAAPALPASPSSLVGREADVAHILALLAASRLVTVTGSGGIGKTRAALAGARHCATRGDTVCFVDFAALTHGAFVVPRIASSVHPPIDGNADSIAALAETLSTRSMLLVLDTCEHVIDETAGA